MTAVNTISLDEQANYIHGLLREGKREIAQFESATGCGALWSGAAEWK